MSVDIALLRKKPQDRIRTVPLFGSVKETAEVLFCGKEEHQQVRDLAAKLTLEGTDPDDAYNLAYGRVTVRDWKGLLDDGAPFPCTPENIDLMMLGSSEFRTSVLTAASSLRGGLEKN